MNWETAFLCLDHDSGLSENFPFELKVLRYLNENLRKIEEAFRYLDKPDHSNFNEDDFDDDYHNNYKQMLETR